MNVAPEPGIDANETGCVVIDGGTFTTSVAELLVTTPSALEITTLYDPASAPLTGLRVKLALVAPVRLAPLNFHW